MTTANAEIRELTSREYKYGFVTDIDSDTVPPGLDEDVIRLISAKKGRAAVHAGLAAQGLPPVAAHSQGAGREAGSRDR